MPIGTGICALACHTPNSTPQIASQLIKILRIVLRLAVELSWDALTHTQR